MLNSEKCPNPDEILANIVSQGGNVRFEVNIDHTPDDDLAYLMVNRAYYLLFQALVEREMIVGDQLGRLLTEAASQGNLAFCKLLVKSGAKIDYV